MITVNLVPLQMAAFPAPYAQYAVMKKRFGSITRIKTKLLNSGRTMSSSKGKANRMIFLFEAPCGSW